MTAPVWIRGVPSDHYGVPVDSVTYFTGGEEEPGRSEKLKPDLPGNIRVETIGPTQTLSQMLLDGEIDALYTARVPSSFLKGGGRVKRLATAGLKTMLPWLTAHLDDARNEMGDDFWSYGFYPTARPARPSCVITSSRVFQSGCWRPAAVRSRIARIIQDLRTHHV